MRISVEIGVSPPTVPPRDLPRATSEKRKLVPHSWQRVALIPTRAPHAGQIFGRGCWSPPKNPRIAFFHFSTRHCHR
jgi:hypothetical protein